MTLILSARPAPVVQARGQAFHPLPRPTSHYSATHPRLVFPSCLPLATGALEQDSGRASRCQARGGPALSSGQHDVDSRSGQDSPAGCPN